jgi:MarR family transcriptional regulator, organic hydroperoxide resistance regulator
MIRTSVPVDRYTAEIDELLHAVGATTKRQAREVMAAYDITPPQCEALLVLKEFGGLAMGELCSKVGSACSTATDLIDRMERNGYVERVRDTADRRVIRLRITVKGEEVIEKVQSASRSNLANQLTSMDQADKERLIQALEQLNDLLKREA